MYPIQRLSASNKLEAKAPHFSALHLVALCTVSLLGLALAGCGSNAHLTSPFSSTDALTGFTQSAGKPLPNARIQLYAATAGAVEPSTLLTREIRSDANGWFSIDDALACPSSNSQLYLVASGGGSVSHPGTSNDPLTLVAAVGDCSDPNRARQTSVSELSTVSAVSTLSPFMKQAISINASQTDSKSLHNAFATARALTDILQQYTASTIKTDASPEFLRKLITAANILSSCTSKASVSVTTDSQCNTLFSYAKTSESASSHDTANALLEIANNPNHNVASIYSLRPSVAPFKPSLSSAPDNWMISASSSMPAPVFSPKPGSYTGTQTIGLSDTYAGAWIFYNVGGNWVFYTGAIAVPSSTTIQTVAIGAGISALVSGTYTITAPTLSLASLASVVAGGTGIGNITLNSAAPAGGTVVHLTSSATAIAAVSPSTITIAQGHSVASFSYQGIAPGTATLSASAAGFAPASAQVMVSAPISLTLSPTRVTLAPAQTQQFQATVFNTANTGVTWNVSPAVGAISTAGLYTAPKSVSTAQNITVTATSVADATKVATATISLNPPVTLTVTPASVSLAPAATQQFTAAVAGTSNSAITWTASGAGCSGSACGTIAASGVYTAPATASAAATVTITATSQANPAVAASAIVTFTPSTGKTYYLSPSGSDSNSGQSTSASWLTPNHSLNCGDTVIAAAGSYTNANFSTGKWGTVTCPASNNVAWLKCATFDGCKIYATSYQGMWVDKSFWGVQGWEVSTAASDLYGTCFIAQPNWATPVNIHHIIFANDVANGCAQAGFATTPNTGSLKGVDYIAVIGSIAYNAAQGGGTCASGISIWEPVQADTAAGTHIYVAGNFSYANLDPSQCAGGTPTDGEGIIFDTFDGSQTSQLTPYAAQAVAYNNILVGNGGKGLEVNNNQAGTSHAIVYLEQNTVYGDLTDPNQSWYGCGELNVYNAEDVEASGNIFATQSTSGCGGHPIYGMSIASGGSSDSIVSNFAFGYGGNNTFSYESGSFSFGSSNTLGTSPAFASAVVPEAPSCAGSVNTVACMASMIHNFTATAAGSTHYGYQPVTNTPVYDSLFPHWLCTAQVPTGLITMGCQAAPQ